MALEKKIAVFLPFKRDLNHIPNFLMPFMDSLISESIKLNYYIQLHTNEQMLPFTENKQYKKYEGIIGIFNNQITELTSCWKQLQKHSTCIKLLGKINTPDENYIMYDDILGIRKICNHVYSEGYKKFAFISSNNGGWAVERYNSFLKFCSEHTDIQTKPEWHVIPDIEGPYTIWKPNVFNEKIRDILVTEKNPDAFICIHNLIAVHCMQNAAETGLRVPEDIAVSGYNHFFNQRTFSQVDKLTAVLINRRLISRISLNILHDMISGKRNKTGQQIILEPELITGTTTLKNSFEKSSHDDKRLKNNIFHFITTNTDKSTAEIIKELQMNLDYSKRYLTVKFRTLFDQPIIPFITSLKIKHAAHELIYTQKPIMNILTNYGFGSYQIFQHHFRKEFNISPKEYREENYEY
jgi:LacI family transcriptional regulator